MLPHLVTACELYLALGALFALAFVTRGVQRIDADARGAGVGFRVLLWPGAALLWPLLLQRWWRGSGPPAERTAHKLAAASERPR